VKWLRFPRVLGIIACVFFLLVAAALVGAEWGDHRWAKDAGRTEGTVTQLVPRPFLGSQRQPRGSQVPVAPEVSYSVDGVARTYTPAHGEMRRRYQVGGTVTVLYDRTDPTLVRLATEGRYGLVGLAAIFVLLSASTVALLIATRRINYVGPRSAPSRPTAAASRGVRP
jgi:hypothetical protein